MHDAPFKVKAFLWRSKERETLRRSWAMHGGWRMAQGASCCQGQGATLKVGFLSFEQRVSAEVTKQTKQLDQLIQQNQRKQAFVKCIFPLDHDSLKNRKPKQKGEALLRTVHPRKGKNSPSFPSDQQKIQKQGKSTMPIEESVDFSPFKRPRTAKANAL